MNLRRIVSRSGQAFRYILDPDTDLVSRTRIDELKAVQGQLVELQRRLEESEKSVQAKDAQIAQLQEQLAAQAQVQEKKTPRPRKTRKAAAPRKQAASRSTVSARNAAPKTKKAAQAAKRSKTSGGQSTGTRKRWPGTRVRKG